MRNNRIVWCSVCVMWSVAFGCKSAPPETQESTNLAEQPSGDATSAGDPGQVEEDDSTGTVLTEELSEELADSGEPEVEGQMDKQVIRDVILKNKNAIRFCYAKHIQKDPTLAGRIDVSFLIGETGAVQSAEVITSTLAHQGVEECVIERVEAMEFPSPQGGVVKVNYPFVFSDGVAQPGEVTGGEPVTE